MERVVDYFEEPQGLTPAGGGERRRLEHLLAGYHAFLGHDLANQLVSIQAFARLLEDLLEKSLDSESSGLLDRLAVVAQQADLHARRLADIGRLMREPAWGPELAFGDLAREAIAQVKAGPRRGIGGNTSGIEYHVVQDTCCIRAARRLLHPVLVELLHNATAAIRDGGLPGRIEVAAHPLEGFDKGAGGILLTVRDTGKGMTTDQLATLPLGNGTFRSARPGASQVTGLGLFLVTQAVARWRGRLTVQSIPGPFPDKGTTLTLFLPPPPADSAEIPNRETP